MFNKRGKISAFLLTLNGTILTFNYLKCDSIIRDDNFTKFDNSRTEGINEYPRKKFIFGNLEKNYNWI